MAHRIVKTLVIACALLTFSGLFIGSTLAETGKKNSGPVNAVVTDSSKTTNEPTSQDDPLAIPTDRLALVFLLICGLLGVTYFGLKKYVNWSRANTSKKRSVGVIDTIPLGGKKYVTVTRVYDRILVLGVAEESINLLTELNEDQTTPTEAPVEKNKSTEHFLNILSSFAGKRKDKFERSGAREMTAQPAATETNAAIL